MAIIAPFNFPMEIPILQIMGALYMGNRVVFKGDSKVSVVRAVVVKEGWSDMTGHPHRKVGGSDLIRIKTRSESR